MPTERRWSQYSIAAEIRHRYDAGEDLSYSYMAASDIALLRATMRYYGSWREGVEAAGIDYESVSRYRTWTPERIIARIKELHTNGADLSWRHVSTRLDPQLAAAATRKQHYGSWRSAVAAAGLDYSRIRRYREWTGNAIIHRLQEMHRQGINLNARHVEAMDITLITAARRKFLSWEGALEAAGLDPAEIAVRRTVRRGRRLEPDKSTSLNRSR